MFLINFYFMKKIVLALSFMFFYNIVSSQKKSSSKDCDSCSDYDLIYDFQCKEYTLEDGSFVKDLTQIKVKHNEAFRFKIINFNRYLYTAEVQIDDVIFQSETPELFSKLFLGEGIDIKPLIKKTSDSLEYADFKEHKISFFDNLILFKDEYNQLVEDNNKAFSLCFQDVLCCDNDNLYSFGELSKSLLELKLSYLESLSNIEIGIIELEKLTKNKEVSKFEQDIKKLDDTIEELLKKNKGKKETKEIKDSKAKKVKLVNEKTDLEVNLKNLEILKINKIALEKLKPELDKLSDDDLLKLVHFKNNIIKNNFEYIVPTVYPKGDLISIKVNIKPNNKPEFSKWQNMPLYEEENILELRVRNKWFYSFSTGPFVGLGSNFKTETFGWKRANQPDPVTNITNPVIDENSKYQLVSTGQQNEPVGISALANFGAKVNNFIGLGASIGVGTTIEEKPKLAYLLGGTIFFGQDKQFNITGGISFIQVEELKKELYNLSPDDFYNSNQELEYNKKFVRGWFISVTYSVFTKSTATKINSSKKNESETNSKKKTDDVASTDEKTVTPKKESNDSQSEIEEPKETPKEKILTTQTKQLVVPVEVLKKGTKFKIKN